MESNQRSVRGGEASPLRGGGKQRLGDRKMCAPFQRWKGAKDRSEAVEGDSPASDTATLFAIKSSAFVHSAARGSVSRDLQPCNRSFTARAKRCAYHSGRTETEDIARKRTTAARPHYVRYRALSIFDPIAF